MKGRIVLETGEVFEGTLISGDGVKTGMLIFDTRVVGYEKILTCPEYSARIVCFTYPLIGNYGINYEDLETEEIFPSALIISEYSEIYSNFRAKCSLDIFLKNKMISVIEGIDTQYLTTLIREKRGMRAAVASTDAKMSELLKELKSTDSHRSPVKISEEKKDVLKTGKPYIAIIDLGVKRSELDMLKTSEFDLLFLSPVASKVEDIMANSSGIYITSGPENLTLIEETASLIKRFVGKIPIFGAGTGHLVIGISTGGIIMDGNILNHYGINHPVADLKENRCYITAQSHSLALERKTIKSSTRFVNINDGTVEGQYDSELKMLSTSFLPRKSNFEEFFSLMKGQ